MDRKSSMKSELVKSSSIGKGTVDEKTYLKRKERDNKLKELGLNIPFNEYNANIDKSTKHQFSKYYKTEGEYEQDKGKATILIDKELPQDLCNKLLYTKQELESRKY